MIYVLDKDRNILIQKAASGNKAKELRKVLSLIEIPIGTGIVGSVVASKQWNALMMWQKILDM